MGEDVENMRNLFYFMCVALLVAAGAGCGGGLGKPETATLDVPLSDYEQQQTELTPEQQTVLEQAVREVFAIDAAIKFQTNADQISGIELSTNGHKLSWHIADYLASLEHSVDRVLEAKTISPAESGAEGYAAG